MILESSVATASDADLLSVGRLNALPYNGTLTLQFQCSVSDGTDGWILTLQKPNGDVPIDNQLIPAGRSGDVGVLDEARLLQVSFPATQGGHFTVSISKVGASANVLSWRAILSP